MQYAQMPTTSIRRQPVAVQAPTMQPRPMVLNSMSSPAMQPRPMVRNSMARLPPPAERMTIAVPDGAFPGATVSCELRNGTFVDAVLPPGAASGAMMDLRQEPTGQYVLIPGGPPLVGLVPDAPPSVQVDPPASMERAPAGPLFVPELGDFDGLWLKRGGEVEVMLVIQNRQWSNYGEEATNPIEAVDNGDWKTNGWLLDREKSNRDYMVWRNKKLERSWERQVEEVQEQPLEQQQAFEQQQEQYLEPAAAEIGCNPAQAWADAHAGMADPSAPVSRESFVAVCAADPPPVDEETYIAFLNYVLEACTGLTLPDEQQDLNQHCFTYGYLISREFYWPVPKDFLGLTVEGLDDATAPLRAELLADWAAAQQDGQATIDAFKERMFEKFAGNLAGREEAFNACLDRCFTASLAMMLPEQAQTLSMHGFMYAALLAGEFYFGPAPADAAGLVSLPPADDDAF